MGAVWAARNELTDRAFAIKFMLSEFARDSVLVQRFFNEARVCGRLDHPSIVEIYDLGIAEELDGMPFLVMELLRGEGLDTMLDRLHHIAPAQVCPLIVEIACALDQAHQEGIVHRDVKPSNIFLHRAHNGEIIPKLLDFGVSKILDDRDSNLEITRVGSVLGSPLYMSPEQARGQADIDSRTDIWALGVVLYEAITGELPFAPGNYNAVLSAILTSRHRPLRELNPEVPAALSDLVDLCLSKDRTRRIASAAQFAIRLEDVLLSLPAASGSISQRPSAPAPISFDESTEVMSREDLLAVLPRLDDEDNSTKVDTEDLQDEAPLSRTTSLRRALLAELGTALLTTSTDDISEDSSPPQQPAPQTSQISPSLSQAPTTKPALTLENESREEPAAVSEERPEQIQADSMAIRIAREALQKPSSQAPPPALPPALSSAPTSVHSPEKALYSSLPQRDPKWLVLAVVLTTLSILLAWLSKR